MPGFIEVIFRRKIPKKYKFLIRASGAFAVFVIVLFVVNPGGTVKDSIENEDYLSLMVKCQSAVQWRRGVKIEKPGTGAEGYCSEFAKKYPEKWEPYNFLSQYHWYIFNFEGVLDNSKKALALLKKRDDLSGGNVDKARLYQRIALAKIGLLRKGQSIDINQITNDLKSSGKILKVVNDEKLGYDLIYYQMMAQLSNAIYQDKTTVSCVEASKLLEHLLQKKSFYKEKVWIYYHSAVHAVHCKENTKIKEYLELLLKELPKATDFKASYSQHIYKLLFTNDKFDSHPNDPILSDKLRLFVSTNINDNYKKRLEKMTS